MKGTPKPFCSETFLSPPRAPSQEQEFYTADATPFEERELLDVCSSVEDDDIVEIVNIADNPKPFAGFGWYRQKQGEISHGRRNGGGSRFSAEAPAKLECSTTKNSFVRSRMSSPARPIDISANSEPKVHRKLGKQRSFPSDIDREEAWERKKELYVMDEYGNQRGERKGRTVARSVSDCGERTCPLDKAAGKIRTRSLTDEDLEELRGCIDLGFGFSAAEDCDLSGTLPALELYYAINRQYMESKSRESPVSPLERGMLYRTSSDDSPCSPLSDSWRISSPGDNPSQVKTRLRHWAQAVACSVKQGLSL